MIINPNLISEGEQVTIQDENKNVLQGPMVLTEKDGRMALKAFKLEIPFARWSTQGRDGLGSYVALKGIKIVGHQPPIDQLAFDVVPQQKFRSNPT